ncbi:class I SAM-dependent methyltransferase [Candidatus Dojkabacteria bacterium]|nr:class I SAM-dependent methyltransferase [Candidatus Dojkabacteria bacterium]
MRKDWENLYKKSGRFYLLPHPEFSTVISKFKTYRAQNILDLGCGSGRHAIFLAQEGFKVTGIDFSKEAISLAKKWAKNYKLKIKFETGNIHKELKYKDGSFDGILAIDSIHYDTRDSLEFTLKESKRVLKQGGLAFITLPTQIGNPAVTHLIFTEEEIRSFVSKYFKIIDEFVDARKFLCLFAISKP